VTRWLKSISRDPAAAAENRASDKKVTFVTASYDRIPFGGAADT
jgi:hypothetical protein